MLHSNDKIGIIITGCVALLCFIIGLVLISGRGAMMIAGYNTMSKKEREKMKEKPLLKAVGFYMMAIAVMIVITVIAAVLSINWLIYAVISVILIGTIPFVIFINKSKRFRNVKK